MQERHHTLDTIRGIAILMVVIFHFIYDLNYFNFTNIPLFSHVFYIYWRYLIVSMFLISVGISLVYAYSNSFNLVKYLKRLSKLALAALAVSLGTYLAFPDSWIYFGILHLIFFSSVLGIVFINHPLTALILGIVILFLEANNLLDLSFIANIFSNYLPDKTLDFYPLFPWLALVLIGIFIAHSKYFKNLNIHFRWLSFLGKSSLLIYLTHQIVLFSLVGLSYYLIVLPA